MAKTTKKSEKKVLGWHFLPKDMKLGYNDNRKAEVGKTLSVKTNPVTCHGGLHASHKPAHAAAFRKGPMMCRVQVWGQIDDDGEKFAGRNRHVLWARELKVKDLQDLLRHVGYPAEASSTDQNDLVRYLGRLDNSNKANKWLENWAKKNGVDGAATTVEVIYVKKPVTEKDLKKFISANFVRTEKEIRADMGEAYDLDGADTNNLPFDDVLNDLHWHGDVRTVEDWKETSNGRYEDGYVLTLKRKR